MIDHRNEPDEPDRDRDQPEQLDPNGSSQQGNDVSTGSYYYDDSTGYEVYDEENDTDDE